jgi:F-type H+-transporting ATPase subunit gamma
VLTAERGLAGGFNAYVVKLARQKIQALLAEGKTVKILTIGKKGREQLARDYASLFTAHVNLADVKGNDFSDAAMGVGQMLTQSYEAGEFDVATLVYSQFRNVLTQVPTAQQLIPAKAPEGAPVIDLGGAIYQYEPNEAAILETLLPRYINTQILSAMLESSAGEQASRMTAMDNATRNAKDLIKSLNLKYNRARQAQITKELIEIISGAEAL